MTTPTPEPDTAAEPRLVQMPGAGFYGIRDYLGTESPGGDDALTFEQRRMRCYELAGHAVALGGSPLVERARLVHGSWQAIGVPERIGHAWVEIPTATHGLLLIWEPITAGLYQEVDFMAYTRAWPERTYDVVTTRKLLGANGHYGRWHESRYP